MSDDPGDDTELLELGRRFEPLFNEWLRLWMEIREHQDVKAEAEEQEELLDKLLMSKADEILRHQAVSHAGVAVQLRAVMIYYAMQTWNEDEVGYPYIGALMRSLSGFYGIPYPPPGFPMFSDIKAVSRGGCKEVLRSRGGK